MIFSRFPFAHCIASLWRAAPQRIRLHTKPNTHSLLHSAALDLTRPRSQLMLENALLRQQLIVLQRHAKRPPLDWPDRALFVLLAGRLRASEGSIDHRAARYGLALAPRAVPSDLVA